MSRRFSAARLPIRSSADSTHSRRSNGWASMSIRPASIFEKSRMSLMIVSSASPESRIVLAKSRWSSDSGVSSSSPLMPITAFIGVRISWLIVARKALLASLAVSAAARASWACLNRRTFWIASADCEARVVNRSSTSDVNGPGVLRSTVSAPMTWSSRSIGTARSARNPAGSSSSRNRTG